MPIYNYKCKCGSSGEMERAKPLTHCPDCGELLPVVAEAKVPPREAPKKVPNPKFHRKRRKLIKFIKALVGSDVIDIAAGKDLWKDTIKGRAKKLMVAVGIDTEEQTKWLDDLDGYIDRAWAKAEEKLK